MQAFYSPANTCNSFKYYVTGVLLQKYFWALKFVPQCVKIVVPRLNYRKTCINKSHSCEGNMLTVSFEVTGAEILKAY